MNKAQQGKEKEAEIGNVTAIDIGTICSLSVLPFFLAAHDYTSFLQYQTFLPNSMVGL